MKKFAIIDIKVLSLPFLVLVVIIMLSVVSAKVFLDNFLRLNSEITDNSKTENILQGKLNSLQSVNPQISTESKAALVALPVSNSIFAAISQMENEALITALTITNINALVPQTTAAQPAIGTGLFQSAEIGFTVEGSYQSINLFIQKLTGILPILKFDSIKITNGGGALAGSSYKMTAGIFTFWSPLPTKIPSIEEPIVALTSDEATLLSQISSKEASTFIQSATTSGSLGRSNPFTQ